MHIYDYSDKDNPKLSEIETVTKIREMPWMYPSVTTILKAIPNPFIETWRVKKAIELKSENPDATYEEINELMWGLPKCPETGDAIPSRDFGTRAHGRIEDLANIWIKELIPSFKGDIYDLFDKKINDEELDESPYDTFAYPILDYFMDNNIKPIETERLIACDKMKIAGRLDLIAVVDSRIALFDYKFRDCSAKNRGKFYDSDCYQLAIEADMLNNIEDLGFIPDIYSVCVCNVTGNVYPKKWSNMMKDRGISMAKAARDFYFQYNLLNKHI